MNTKTSLKLGLTLVVVLALLLLSGCPPPTQSAAPQPQGPSPAEFLIQTVWFILMCIFIYFMLVARPQAQKDEAHKKFIDGLNKNDEVILSSGIFGRVVEKKDLLITVEVSPNVKLRVLAENIQAPPKLETKTKTDTATKDGKKNGKS